MTTAKDIERVLAEAGITAEALGRVCRKPLSDDGSEMLVLLIKPTHSVHPDWTDAPKPQPAPEEDEVVAMFEAACSNHTDSERRDVLPAFRAALARDRERVARMAQEHYEARCRRLFADLGSVGFPEPRLYATIEQEARDGET